MEGDALGETYNLETKIDTKKEAEKVKNGMLSAFFQSNAVSFYFYYFVNLFV